MFTRPFISVAGDDPPLSERAREKAHAPTLGLERRRLVVVDAHGHAFRAFWALAPTYAPDGLPTNALFGLAGLLRRLVLEEQPDYIAVVFDAPDDVRRTFRTGLYPAYKAHRPERPAELAQQIPLLRDVARALGLLTLEHPDFEADDLVATIVAQAEAADVHSTILSADKDLLQLVSDRTLVWDAMRGKRYTKAGVEDKLGVPPHLVADYLALVGDTSDNVPGVPGIGPKSASGLLRAYGSLAGVYAALDQIPARERKKLVEHRARAELSRALTELRTDVPLAVDLSGLRRPALPEDRGEALWARLGFASFMPPARRRRPDAEPERWDETTPMAPPAWHAEAPWPGERDDRLAHDDVTASAQEDDTSGAHEDDTSGAHEAPATAIDVHDRRGLMLLVREARAMLALGVALAGDPPPRASLKMTRRPEVLPAYAPPVVGVALPSGTMWRIHVQGGEANRPGRPQQGSLFSPPEADIGVALADVAAALCSLLSDARRVVAVHDAKKVAQALAIGPSRIALDARTRGGEDGGAARLGDPAATALEALSCWLASTTGNAL